MRYAVILAPWDPDEPYIAVWLDAVAWLGSTLANLGFRVVAVHGTGDALAETERALAQAGPNDTVLLHVSGHLARRGVLGLPGGQWLALRALGDVLAERALSDVSILAELIDDGEQDPLSASDQVDAVVGALGARERGYGVVATVRAAAGGAAGFAFTRLLMRVARAAPPEEALLSHVFSRVAAMPERLSVQGIAFERGRADLRLVPQPADGELDEPIAAATDAGNWRRVVELRRMRLRGHGSVRARVRELVSIARVLQAELDDAEGAIAALEEARAIDPKRVPVLQALRRGYERLGRWASAIDCVGALAHLAETASDRAELGFACARMVLEHLQDEERTVALLHETLEDDPTHERARALLAGLLAPGDDVEEALGSEDLVPEALDLDEAEVQEPDAQELEGQEEPEGEAPESQTPESQKLEAPVREAHVPQPEGLAGGGPDLAPKTDFATDDTEEAVALQDIESQGAAGDEVEEDTGPTARALAARGDALDALTHAEAFAAHRREGRTDQAFLAALALEELEQADVDQQVLIDQFRSVAPIRARGALDANAWALLRARGVDQPIAALFAAVARPAVAVRLQHLAARGRIVELDPSTRVNATSTALVARTFHWAARVLGVPCPGLYLADRVPGDIAAVRAPTPSTAVGPGVVRGRSPKELAFLAGRHLTYYRPEHEVAIYYPTRQDLISLLFASVQIVRPNAKPPEGEAAVAALSRSLAAKITDCERGALYQAVRQIESSGGTASVGGWTRGIELTAARAGLLLSGDLATATTLVRTETRSVAELSFEEKRRDLVAFCVSEAHATLRSRHVVVAPESVRPPPPHVAGRAMAVSGTAQE